MRLSALNRMHVVQKEEKEQRLKEFIARALAARRDAGDTTKLVYRLIALSPESPVAKALADAANEAASLGIDIEAVFLRPVARGGATPSSPFTACRYVSDTRMIDAHEQLVLGAETTWIGDCMRRDPWKRDAFECFSTECATIASRATRSFERIWSMGKPARRGVGQNTRHETGADGLLDPSLIANADQVPAAFVLRH